jgi:peptidoglycan/LPS O-acetylase OafA/YrhL
MSASKTNRLPALDLLRAAAIALVLVAHYPKNGHGLAQRVLNFGWTGVDLFFVLSGYLIGGQLLQPIAAGEPMRLAGFYVRRLMRTLPPYYVVLPIYLMTAGGWNWEYVFLVQNFRMPPTFTPSWSLCVEEQFYLLFPAIAMLLFYRNPRRALLFGLPLFLGLELAIRTGVWMALRPDLLPESNALSTYMERLYYPTWCRLDGIALGVALAGVRCFLPGVWRRAMDRPGVLFGISAVFLVLAAAAFWYRYSLLCSTAAFTLLNLSFTLLTAAALSDRSLMARVHIPGASWVALTSYSIYLTHSLAIDLTRGAGTGITVAVILAFAAALHYGVERPSMRLRDILLRSEQSRIVLSARLTTPGVQEAFTGGERDKGGLHANSVPHY